MRWGKRLQRTTAVYKYIICVGVMKNSVTGNKLAFVLLQYITPAPTISVGPQQR